MVIVSRISQGDLIQGPNVAPALDQAALVRGIVGDYAIIVNSRRQGILAMLRCGSRLLQIRATIPHGEWEDWIKHTCGFTSRTANNYMTAARKYPYLVELAFSCELGNPLLPADERLLEDMPMALLYLGSKPMSLDGGAAFERLADPDQTMRDTAEIVTDMLIVAHDQATVNPHDVKRIMNVIEPALLTGALDPGTGQSLALSEAFESALTQEHYEALMRMKEHVRSSRENRNEPRPPSVTIPLDNPTAAAKMLLDALKKHALPSSPYVTKLIEVIDNEQNIQT